MVRMSTADVVRATSASVVVAGSQDVCGSVVIDSRQVGPGSLFVAFAGEKVDGNAYVAKAVEAGAAAVAVTAEPEPAALAAARAAGCTVLRAEGDDGEEFLLRLAGAWRAAHKDWLVVGVTGSVGKTTTKDMLRAGIASQRRCHATAGNFNNLIGLPLTLLSAPEDSEVVVCELGMNHPHEIDRLAAAAAPTLGVVTNVGTSHIGLLGSRENIARAKAEIVGGLVPHDGLAPRLALTSSGDFTPFISEKFCAPAGVATDLVGTRATDCVRALDVRLGADGCASLTLACDDGWRRELTLQLPGKKVVDDLLLAVDVIWRLGLDRDAAVDAVLAMPATHMRLEVQTAASGARVIDDSYNAAPNSIASSLDVLASMDCTGRRIAVLGEIGELGEAERVLHGYVGAYAAGKNLDLLALIGGDLADVMAEAARTMGFSEDALERFATVDDAVAVLGPVLGPGDVVLVKASRSAGLDRFVKGVL